MRRPPPALFALCALLLLEPRLHAADDVISVPAVTYVAPGGTADVPVYVQDLSGSPVGLDISKSIRYLQFTLQFSRPELIKGCTVQPTPKCSVAFTAAGVLARKAYAGDPITFVDSASILVRRIIANTISWTLDGAAPGDLIGYVHITADPDAPPGSEIGLAFSSTGTLLGDQQLTVSESDGQGLRLSGGTLIVADCTRAPVASELDFTWRGGITGCTPESGTCQSGETIVFTPHSSLASFGACETISWDFDDGSSGLANDPEPERQFPPGEYDVTMTIATQGGSPVVILHKLTVADPCNLPPLPSQMSFTYTGTTSTCSGFPDLCGKDELLHFTAHVPDALSACSTYTWNFGDNSATVIENDPVTAHAYVNTDTYTVTLTVTTNGGQVSREQKVNVAQQIVCSANVPATARINELVTFDDTFDIAGSHVYWSFGSGFATVEDPQVSFPSTVVMQWYLVVSHDDYASCQRSGTIEIVAPRRRAARNGQ